MFNKKLSDLLNPYVLRTSGIYVASMLVIMRLSDQLGPTLGAGSAFNFWLSIFLVLGFPVALIIAWRYSRDKAKERESEEVEGDPAVASIPDGEEGLGLPFLGGLRLKDLVLIVIVLAVGYLFIDRNPASEPAAVADSHKITTQYEEAAVEPPAATISNASIAVLPFVNFSENKEFAYFAAGVHEDVLTYLSRVPDLLVISRTSVMQFADTQKTIPEIAAELKVAHILEGSVRRAGSRVRITVQLIRARDDIHLWAENYDRELTDVFAIQTEVAELVAQTLSRHIDTRGSESLSALTRVPEAYDLFAQGRRLIRLPSADSARRGLQMFEDAIALDPDYAEAHAGIALALHALSKIDLPWESVKERAIESARRGISLAQDSAYVEFAIAQAVANEDPRAAEGHLKRALALAPNDGEVRLAYVDLLRLQARYAELIEQLKEAARRDPLSPRVQLARGRLALLQGQSEVALGFISKALDSEPDNAYYHVTAGTAHAISNNIVQTLGHYGLARVLDPHNSRTYVQIAATLLRVGHFKGAEAWLDASTGVSPPDVEWYDISAQLYTATGLYDALTSLVDDLERHAPKDENVPKLRASAVSQTAHARRDASGIEAARPLDEKAVELLEAFLLPFKRPSGYDVTYINAWSVLSLGVERQILGRDGTELFQAIIDAFAGVESGVILLNRHLQLTIAYAGLGNAAEARAHAWKSLEKGGYIFWVLQTYGLVTDNGGVYHGLTETPEWREILRAMQTGHAETRSRIEQVFPAILDPDHPDWQNVKRLKSQAMQATLGGI